MKISSTWEIANELEWTYQSNQNVKQYFQHHTPFTEIDIDIPQSDHLSLSLKMEMEMKFKGTFSAEYLPWRIKLLNYMEKVNKVLMLPIHCIEYSIRILDRYFTISNLLPSDGGISILSLTAIQLTAKFITERDFNIDDITEHFCLNASQMVLLETDIVSKLEYELILPSISDYYDILYDSQPPPFLLQVLKSSELSNSEMLYVAIGMNNVLGKLTKDVNSLSTNDLQRVVQEVVLMVNVIKNQFGGYPQM